MSPDPEVALGRLRTICLELPEASEKLSHGAPAFAVAGKMFAYFWHNHHGDGLTAVLIKTGGRDEQEMLIDRDPDLYSRPPYLGPSGWIAMNVAPADTDWDHVGDRIAQSWELAAPRRLLEAGGR
jgi:hypothetical protein